MSPLASNHTPLDDALARFDQLLEAAHAETRPDIMHRVAHAHRQITPALLQQLDETHEQMFADLVSRDPHFNRGVKKMETADLPLLNQWYDLGHKLEQVADQQFAGFLDAESSADKQRKSVLLEARQFLTLFRDREDKLSAYYMGAFQQDQGNAFQSE